MCRYFMRGERDLIFDRRARCAVTPEKHAWSTSIELFNVEGCHLRTSILYDASLQLVSYWTLAIRKLKTRILCRAGAQ